MAYYAASPPPNRAPSLAPTSTSDGDGSSKKKKKPGFMKRALKELGGGGGNNAKTPKGAPVVRPYGRGGVGIKSSKPSSTSTQTSPQSTPTPSSHSQPPTTHSQLTASSKHHPEYSSGYTDTDDTRSLASSIPAPRRTQQWIEQQSPSNHLIPPNIASPPPIARPVPTHYYPPESPSPTNFTGSDDNSNQYAHYLAQQHQLSTRRLHDVQEHEDHLEDQFGRLTMGDHRFQSARERQLASLNRPNTLYSESASSSDYALYNQQRLMAVHNRDPASPDPSAHLHHNTNNQTHELQAQIDSLREAERLARERLEALRKEELSASLQSRRDGQTPTTAGRILTREEHAMEEKEKLRQRDAARERDERERQAGTSSSPTALPTAIPTFPQQHSPPLAGPYVAQQQYYPPTPQLHPAYQDPQQQQLILQLSTLLLQQQQQLSALGVGRPGPAYPTPGGGQPGPAYPTAPGFDMNALLALGAAQAAAVAAQTQSPHPGYVPSSSPAAANFSSPVSPTSTNPSNVTPSHLDPNPSPSTHASPTGINPLQIRRKRSTGTPITNAHNRDQGNPPLPNSSQFSNTQSNFSHGLHGTTTSPAPILDAPTVTNVDMHASPPMTATAPLSPPPPPYVGRSV